MVLRLLFGPLTLLFLFGINVTPVRAEATIPYGTFDVSYALNLPQAERSELEPLLKNDGGVAEQALPYAAEVVELLTTLRITPYSRWGRNGFELDDAQSFCATQYPKLAVAMTHLSSYVNMQTAQARSWAGEEFSPALDSADSLGSNLCECSFWCMSNRKAGDLLNTMKAQLSDFSKKERSILDAKLALEKASENLYESGLTRMRAKQAEIIDDIGGSN